MKSVVKFFLVVFLVNLCVVGTISQQLTIYVIPSPVDRSWESPREIIFSSAKNLVYPEKSKKHFMGHVFIHLKNGDESYLTGSTMLSREPVKNMLLKEGIGLGILTADIEGMLEPSQKLFYELAQRYQNGNISFIRFKISHEMYLRLKYYLDEYQKNDYDNIYNGQNKPREGKGAGCSAFGTSFIEVAGFMKNEWLEKWVKKARIPSDLIGNKEKGFKVGALKMILRNKWAKADEPHRLVCMFDPNAIHNWIVDQAKNVKGENVQILRHNKAIGLEYDYTQSPCPDEAVFKKASDDSWVVQE